MTDRRSSKHHPTRITLEERYRTLENALKHKIFTNDFLRDEITDTSPQSDLSSSSCVPIEPSCLFKRSQRSNLNSYRNSLSKDREIAKLKALVYQKDTEIITLVSTHKNALLQVEDRMERERKVWNEHKELLLADERSKFEEEKNHLFKDLQYQLNLERERCQHLEKKIYDAQTQSSEAKFLLKESDRERINAIYSIKEQCRNEYQDEIIRLRNQFQLEKDNEFARIQSRIHELEQTVTRLSNGNADAIARQHKLLFNLETAEKACVRSMNDVIKKLLMAIDGPPHIYSTIPNVSSFVYDETSVIERIPTRNILKFLLNTVDDIRNYIVEQRAQIETKTLLLQKSKTNRTCEEDNNQQQSNFKHKKENEFQLTTRQNDTVDNLIQKLEDNIALELDRLSKQRTVSNQQKVMFEYNHLAGEVNQDTLIRHLQNRMNDLRNDNMRLRDNQQTKSIFSAYHENNNQPSLSSISSRTYPTTQ